jgi:hypothetical protein
VGQRTVSVRSIAFVAMLACWDFKEPGTRGFFSQIACAAAGRSRGTRAGKRSRDHPSLERFAVAVGGARTIAVAALRIRVSVKPNSVPIKFRDQSFDALDVRLVGDRTQCLPVPLNPLVDVYARLAHTITHYFAYIRLADGSGSNLKRDHPLNPKGTTAVRCRRNVKQSKRKCPQALVDKIGDAFFYLHFSWSVLKTAANFCPSAELGSISSSPSTILKYSGPICCASASDFAKSASTALVSFASSAFAI